MRLYDWFSWVMATAVLLGCCAVGCCVGVLLLGAEGEE